VHLKRGVRDATVGDAGVVPTDLRRRLARLRRLGQLFHGAATALAVGLLLLAAALVTVLALDAWPAIQRYGVGFLTGQSWDVTNNVYGALPAIVGTLLTSGLALVMAVPVALGVAIFSSEIAPQRARGALAVVIDLGATIPSIVYGFWALIVLVPLMRTTIEPGLATATGGRFPFSGHPIGIDVLTASLILAIMIIPTVAALSREALWLTPRARREGALALGANRWEAARMAVLGPARPAIFGAIMVGFGRAIGETIAVTLVIGNIYVLPTSLFSQGQTIPSQIVGLFGGSYGIGLSALIGLGLLLFIMSFVINVAARLLIRWRTTRNGAPTPRAVRTTLRHAARRHDPPRATIAAPAWWPRITQGRTARLHRRRVLYFVVVGLLLTAVVLAVLPLASVVDTAVVQGGSAVIRPSFYTSEFPPPCIGNPPANCTLGGIGPAIEGTLILLGLAASVAVPAGILGGIYLIEYGRNRFGRFIGLIVDVMIGIPSILIGVFVFALFLYFDRVNAGGGGSALAGAVALGVLMVPIVVRATASALQTVPGSAREGALALGFPRHRVTLRVVLGSCKGAIVTGVLLALGRAGGETAALLLTVGYTTYWFSGLNQPTAALAPFIYNVLINNDYPNLQTDAWGAALVLLLIMVVVSLLARYSLRGRAAAELA